MPGSQLITLTPALVRPRPAFTVHQRTNAARLRASATPRNARDEMPALTGVRFPLAIWVVVHHLSGPGKMLDSLTSGVPVLQNLVECAWIALGVFFAISGFVLTLRYRSEQWSPTAFTRYGIARFARLYPLYFFSLLILSPIIAAAISSGETGNAGRSAGLVLNYVLLLQGWAPLTVDWNTPAWSLSCEVLFYTCFPALILILRKLTWSRVCGLLSIAIALPVAVRLFGVSTTVKPLIYSGDFLIGMAAAGVFEMLNGRGSRIKRSGPWLYGPAVALILVLMFFARTRLPFMLFDSILRVGVGALVLGLAFGCRALSSSFVLWGGRASYAIYILHVPILWWYKRSSLYTTLPPVEAGLIYLTLVVVVSFLICRWLEQPAEKYVRNRLVQALDAGRTTRTASAA